MKRSSKDGNAASLIRDSQFDETDRREYAALLKHAQQPGLKPCLELANFVEKQHAAIGRPDQAFAVALGARNAARRCPKSSLSARAGLIAPRFDNFTMFFLSALSRAQHPARSCPPEFRETRVGEASHRGSILKILPGTPSSARPSGIASFRWL